MTTIKHRLKYGHRRVDRGAGTFDQNSDEMKNQIAFLFLLTVSLANAQQNCHATGGSMRIKGTSNVHEWDCSGYEVRANGSLTTDASGLKTINSLYVEIPVKAIKSTKGSIMDNKMYDALKADGNPNVAYSLERVTGINKRGGGYDINTTGYLKIAGVSRKVDMYVWGQVGGDQSITFNGSKKIKMTDFGISPPTALMGTMTTGDEVEVIFQVTLKQ
jgi:polyisoprenoid-binding protein YceI